MYLTFVEGETINIRQKWLKMKDLFMRNDRLRWHQIHCWAQSDRMLQCFYHKLGQAGICPSVLLFQTAGFL